MFDSRHIDLLILDLGLPIRSGWDAFERITNEAPRLPIIIITGQANQCDMAVAAGVGALMEKPLDAPLLLQTIRELLAEPKEVRLRRLSVQDGGRSYLPSAGALLLDRLRKRRETPLRWRQFSSGRSG